MKPPFLNSVRVRNFKAIRNSGSVRLTPLTVFIGNNGSGKSSLIEALETLQVFITRDLDAAINIWRGFEHIRNKAGAPPRQLTRAGNAYSSKPVEFALRGHDGNTSFWCSSVLNERRNRNELFIQNERLTRGRDLFMAERWEGSRLAFQRGEQPASRRTIRHAESALKVELGGYVGSWQFLNLWPQAMGNPAPQVLTGDAPKLIKDGSNVAQYLLDIRDRSLPAFEGLVDALKHVLPYATDVQPTVTSELQRTVYLQLTEQSFKVPGWLLSTGTLRILALLALLRHPEPPPLIVVEEIENGLDPRTIHLLVDEIRQAVEAHRTQVIVATHSPYLLDLLPLESIVLVERVHGEPVFSRPADDAALRKWAKEFTPGQLFTMNRLGRSGRR